MTFFQTNINALVSGINSQGVKHAVICPGSRNAPLIMAISRHPEIKSYSAVDERSAGFIALGLAKQLNQPVLIACTSGSAVVNIYPAVTEAYYMQVPLLVISADRPSDLIDRWDGQAIHQFEVFGSHVKHSLQTSEQTNEDLSKPFFELGVSAVTSSIEGVRGPVHINVPLREPLYLDAASDFVYPEFPVKHRDLLDKSNNIQFPPEFLDPKNRLMVLNGAGSNDANCNELIQKIKKTKQVVVVSDVISGKHGQSSFLNWESVLLNVSEDQKMALVPDILISTGKMVLNKTLKQLLKENKPKIHWHIAENAYCADTFHSNPICIQMTETDFFSALDSKLANVLSAEVSYYNSWKTLSQNQIQNSKGIIESQFNELDILRSILNSIKEQDLSLHLANSMCIRLAAFSADLLKQEWHIESNRGVSGIDGSTSTAVGMALADRKQHLLISGDLAFFYDINAFMTNQLPENLKIVVLNNQGGGIFMNIDGPSAMKEADPYMLTPHHYSAKHISSHFGLAYFSVRNQNELQQILPEFHAAKGICVLEVFTDKTINSSIFKQYKHIQI